MVVEVLLFLLAVVLGLGLWRLANAGDTPEAGDSAPGFALPDQNGELRTLEEFSGRNLVLYFYPRDDTPGCVEQAMRFRNSMRDLEALGAAVCGISVDDSSSHAAFALKYKLPFTLLADRDGVAAARYGSLRDFGVVKFAKRNTFLIDPSGRIAKVYLGVQPARNADDVIADLKATQSPAVSAM
jgi:peroxiredoxin Q/BCP